MSKVPQYYKQQYHRLTSFSEILHPDHSYLRSTGPLWNNQFKGELISFLVSGGVIPSPDIDLKNLHALVDAKYLEFETVSEEKNNNSRPVIEDLMFEFAETDSLQRLYHSFLKWLHATVIKKNFYFQRIPTIRVRTPSPLDAKILALPTWHADSFFGHSPKELNVWLGLTDNDRSGFYVKTLEDSQKWFGEYGYDRTEWTDNCYNRDPVFDHKGFVNAHEVQNPSDSVFLFDSRCIHTATYRTEVDPTTRISIDVRIILVEDYEWVVMEGVPVFKGLGIQKAEFRPGTPFGYHENTIESLQ
tara:strand:- start:5764 stop:6666 length:903 start_codon:yes stop_codon:yes gene_type:complete